MTNSKLFIILAILTSGLAFANCTPKKMASDITAQIFKGGSPSFETESDIEIAETSGIPLIKIIEAFQFDNPKNKLYRILLSRAYGTYAFGFLEFNMLQYQNTEPELYEKNFNRARHFYTQGKMHGLEVLKAKDGFKNTLNKDLASFKKSLNGFGKNDVPALFWTAFNWGSLINLSKDSPVSLAEVPKVEAIMKRVLELDETYYYGGPHLFFGAYYGSRAKMFGGDPDKSKTHFEKALTLFEHKFLLAQVTYAQIYAVQNQDFPLFEKLLNEVLNSKTDILPEQRLGNEIAYKKARWLLDHAQLFFKF